MKSALLSILVGICILGGLSASALAYVEPTDVILDQNADSVYLIGWVYARLSDMPQKVDDHVIYRIDLKSQAMQVVYRGNKLDRLKLSPDGKYFSVLKGHESFVKSSELSIVDIKGKREVVSFRDDLRKYAWSPDSRKIAYVTGENIEGRGLHSTGAWVLEIAKKDRRKIAAEASDVEWLNGSTVFIINKNRTYDRRRHRNVEMADSVIFDVGTGKVERGSVRGMDFSLDGRYSLVPTADYGDITADEDAVRTAFYDVAAGRLLPEEKVSNMLSQPSRIVWDGFVWLKGHRVLVQRADRNTPVRELTICDVETNSVLKTIKGQIVGVNQERNKIVLFIDGRLVAEDVP